MLLDLKSQRKRKVACVVLAAGMAERFGKVKLLAKMESGNFLVQTAVNVANQSKAEHVLLVVGSHSSEILARLRAGRSKVVLNKNFQRGLSSSIKCALESLPSDSEAALFMVADQPFLNNEILDSIIEGFDSDADPRIVSLAYKGDPRNPVLIPRKFFHELSRLEGDAGAREIVRRNIDEVRLINVEDARVFLDIDTQSDLAAAGFRG